MPLLTDAGLVTKAMLNTAYRQNMSKVQIAKETGFNRSTVQKYIPIKGSINQRCTNQEAADLAEKLLRFRRSDIDREVMEAEFGYALCCAATTYEESKGSFSGWAFWYFYNAFMHLLRDRHKRGIATTRGDIKTTNIPVGKCREKGAETSIESLQEDGKLRARSHQMPRVSEQAMREMRDDYQILRKRINGIRLEIIESRMRGESYKSIGARHKLSKQRIHMLTVEAIEQMQRSMK